MRIGVVCDEALQIADGNGRVTHLEMDTMRFALFLLRADTSADGRQRRALFDDCGCAEDIAFFQFLDESGDLYVDRATLYAGGVLAVEAAVGFRDCLLEGQTWFTSSRRLFTRTSGRSSGI